MSNEELKGNFWLLIFLWRFMWLVEVIDYFQVSLCGKDGHGMVDGA